jgi:ABC-2 type transport system permease protein
MGNVAAIETDGLSKLDTGLAGVRYVSIFRYYGDAIESGLDPLAFLGLTGLAVALLASGAMLFERRDLAA